MTETIELRDVSLTYRGPQPVHAISNLSLSVGVGELVCVMGPSGSGKSSLLALAAGLARPTAGEVLVHGAPMQYDRSSTARRLRTTVGVVYQSLNLLPGLTAGENVSLPLDLDRRSRREATELARAALADVDLAERFDAFPDELSGGEQQRIAIARALIGDRAVVVADEPTGALDSLTGELIMRLIRRRCDAGASALVATHDATMAAFAHRVIFLRDGSIATESPALTEVVA